MIEGFGATPLRAASGVDALLRDVGAALALRFSVCTVRGEISGLARAASGHSYFNLKDADGGVAMLRCAMFRRAAGLLSFAPADGQVVEIRGRLGVYEPRGELQLVVEAMQPAGAGALYEQFLQTKAGLEAQGLFAAGRKRSVPAYPRAIGVVTSLGAAALHDVLSALARRAPQVRVLVYPSPVQGADAPAALAAAIAVASQHGLADVLIVCRGGGSLEDLGAFNDERVVRAIVGAAMPVISGVGHETDVTLADFAADLRAPTPTAAAELATSTRQSQVDALDAIARTLHRRVHESLDTNSQRLDRIGLRLARPGQGLHLQAQRLALLAHRLLVHLPRRAASHQTHLAQQQGELRHRATLYLAGQAQRVAGLDARLRALDPTQVLARGYAWLGDDRGRAVTSVHQLSVGASIQALLHDGSADMQVTRILGRTNG